MLTVFRGVPRYHRALSILRSAAEGSAPPRSPDDVREAKTSSVDLIRLDVARTFPQLGLFQKVLSPATGVIPHNVAQLTIAISTTVVAIIVRSPWTCPFRGARFWSFRCSDN